jgi:hypothetical protein
VEYVFEVIVRKEVLRRPLTAANLLQHLSSDLWDKFVDEDREPWVMVMRPRFSRVVPHRIAFR